jgi:hypothetical protein
MLKKLHHLSSIRLATACLLMSPNLGPHSALSAQRSRPERLVSMRAGKLRLAVSRKQVQAYPSKRAGRPDWTIIGAFRRLPIIVKHGGFIVLDGASINNSSPSVACITPIGSTVWHYTVLGTFQLVASSQLTIYSDHSGNYRGWSADSYAGEKAYWHVFCRTTSTGKLVWEKNIFEVGEPVGLVEDKDLWTIRQIDAQQAYQNRVRPTYNIELHDARSGKLTRSWPLPKLASKYGDWPDAIVAKVESRANSTVLKLAEGYYTDPLKKPAFENGVTLDLQYRRDTSNLSWKKDNHFVRLLLIRSP